MVEYINKGYPLKCGGKHAADDPDKGPGWFSGGGGGRSAPFPRIIKGK